MFFTIINNKQSILGFIGFLKMSYKNHNFYFGYEATNNYSIILKEIISTNKLLQIQINPYKMSLYIKHLNTRIKDDINDSFAIAKYISSLSDDGFKTNFNKNDVELKKLNAILLHLKKMLTQLNNFQKSQKDINLPDVDLMIENLKNQIKDVEKKIRKFAISYMYKIHNCLLDIKKNIVGVGDTLLLSLAPYLNNQLNYNKKQLFSFFGLSPKVNQSGKSVVKKDVISKQGNSLVRKNLYMCTMCCIRFNDIIKAKFEKMVNKMIVIGVCNAYSEIFIY